jgi:hypothetical protein
MVDLDWIWLKKIERSRLEAALSLNFLREGRNVALMGAHCSSHASGDSARR